MTLEREEYLGNQILDLETKLRDSEAGAAAMRAFIVDLYEALGTDLRKPGSQWAPLHEVNELWDGIEAKRKAALSSTAGVALLERVGELERILRTLCTKDYCTNMRTGACHMCGRRNGHNGFCIILRAQGLLK